MYYAKKKINFITKMDGDGDNIQGDEIPLSKFSENF